MTAFGRFVRLPAAALLLGLVPAVALAQGTTISGRVTSGVNATPISQATVSIPGLRIGAQTDAQGRYSFTVPAAQARGAATITARRLGYQMSTLNVTLGGTGIVADFKLIPAATELNATGVTAM